MGTGVVIGHTILFHPGSPDKSTNYFTHKLPEDVSNPIISWEIVPEVKTSEEQVTKNIDGSACSPRSAAMICRLMFGSP